MDKERLLDAYRKVSIDELYKVVDVVEDAIMRWASRIGQEPSLRFRIRHGHECIEVVQQAIREKETIEPPVELQ